MKKLKRRSILLISSGLILIVAAGLLAAYNLWDDYRASSAAEDVLQRLNEICAEQNEASVSPLDNYPNYELNPDTDMPAVTVNSYRYIGTVTILPLEIELPVMEDWDYTRMKIAPCCYYGSAYLDNFVICAHSYRSHFGRLDKLQKNDTVIFTDTDGNVFRYEVAEIDVLSETAVEEMTSGDWDLTLFTCTYSGRARVTVRCNRVDIT